MAQCVLVSGTSLVIDAAPVESCTGYVLATSQEFQNMQTVWIPLTLADGAIIGASMFAAWAVAWGFRMIGGVIEDAEV